MKPRSLHEMIKAKDKLERGEATPAKVWEVLPDGKGGFTQRAIAPDDFKCSQKATCNPRNSRRNHG